MDLLTPAFNKLDMFSGENPEQGFYWVSGYEKQLNPYIHIALGNASKYKASAVYFRLFNDDRPPIPQIYVFDFTLKSFNEKSFALTHKQIWNSIQVPLIYVFLATEVLIFNSYSPDLKADQNFSFFEKISIANVIDEKIKQKNELLLKDFSAKNFANGSFWENEKYRKDFVVEKGVYETLISKLDEIRKKLIETKNIFTIAVTEEEKIDFIHRLLVMTILIKYLEERKDEDGNTVFADDYFSKYQLAAKCFVDVLYNQGNVLKLFEDLSVHFNGEVFELNEREKEIFIKLDLKKFAEFLEGKTEIGSQISIWRLYSFNDLPIELISNIYEQFLKKDEPITQITQRDKNKAGIFYTPPYLANFLIDRLLPLSKENNKTDVKILDPACGSGIFLVQAYKRLIFRWKQANNWKKPSQDDLKVLLNNCIYGVDIKRDAIRLTAFSLVLTLCNELTPLEIWGNLKFDTLKNNLFIGDFFEILEGNKFNKKFDILIGNPPFIVELTSAAKQIENGRISEGLAPLPDNFTLSFLFLSQALKIIKQTGNICLLFPADSLLYRKNHFTDDFLKNVNIPLIVDFTPLRRTLFKSATVATVAVFYNLQKKEENVTHLIARRTKTSRNELFFELDKYDICNVEIAEALKNRFVWKVNLFGVNNRSYELLKKLNSYRKFSVYLKKQKGKLSVRKPRELLPYLLIKKNLGDNLLLSQVIKNSSDTENSLKSEVKAIYSSSTSTELLESIKSVFDANKKVYKYFALNTSDRAALGRSASTILGSDIEKLPYTESNLLDALSDIEKLLVSDCVDYWDNFIRLGENSIALEKAPAKALNEFGNWYLQVLNSVYKNYKKAEPFITASHIIYPFYWGDKNKIPSDISSLENKIECLLQIEMPQASLRFVRILRLYDENVIYMIKPNQIRYWLKSVAVMDADETFAYLVKREYANESK